MEEPERPSKSQRKREMAGAAGNRRTSSLSSMPINSRRSSCRNACCEAILEAQRIRDFEGRRRQMQYIGKLMREVDPAPIRARLEQWHGAAREHTASQRLIERWRERLLADDGALAMFAAEYPGSDLQQLRTLIASVKRDRGAG